MLVIDVAASIPAYPGVVHALIVAKANARVLKLVLIYCAFHMYFVSQKNTMKRKWTTSID